MSHSVSTYRVQTRDNILVLLLIIFSGNPLAIYSTEWLYGGYVVILLLYLFMIGRLVITNYVYKWLIGFVVLFSAQLAVVRTVSIPADINFIAKFLIAYITVWICGKRFCDVYTRWIYTICLISLFFYCFCCLNIAIPGIKFDRYITLGIWNYLPNKSLRNCGMFWEPGAFQGFVMLAFLFNIDRLPWLWKNRRKQVTVFALAIFSTLSTTAYGVVFTFGFLMLMTSKLKFFYKIVMIVVALFGAVYAFYSFDFLGAKIQDEVEHAESTGANKVNWSRTGAMLIELSNIARHPLVGNGFLMDSRYKGFGELMSGAGNGLFGSINIFGLPMVIIYFIAVARSWRNTRRSYQLIVVVILMMLLFGEFFLNYPLFWGLLFLKLPYVPERRKGLLPRD